jgi:hypothetical protein
LAHSLLSPQKNGRDSSLESKVTGLSQTDLNH